MIRPNSHRIWGVVAAAFSWLAAVTVCAQEPSSSLLRPFFERIEQTHGGEDGPPVATPEALDVPGGFRPWWEGAIAGSLSPSTQHLPVDLDTLILSSLIYSAHVQWLGDARLIAQTDVSKAGAVFDWSAFVESKYVDTSEPVGNTLTTGGSPRFRDNHWTAGGGFRRRTASGGQFELAQRIGYQDTNSFYFVPTQQGTGTFALSFAQPLLRGAGRSYNTRLIVLAQLEAKSADEEFVRRVQAHLLEITRTYWQLYLSRAVVLQKRRLYDEACRIYEELESRREVDATVPQILQAKAAVARRRAEILRTEMAVKNMESRLRALVNAPELAAAGGAEFLPQQSPVSELVPVNMKEAKTNALCHRPEIKQSLNTIEAAKVKLNVSKNELLPALDLILETYANGLRGGSDVGGAITDQFSKGEPSYTVGLALDMPLANRAAEANHRKQELELRKTIYQLVDAVENVLAEVEVAVREAQTSYREMTASYHAMVAKEAEVRSLDDRWRALAGDSTMATVLLEQLLRAQEELAAEQFALADAQVSYSLALTRVKQADGTLLQIQPVANESSSGSSPGLLLEPRAGAVPAVAPRSASQLNRPSMPATVSQSVPIPTAETPRVVRLPAIQATDVLHSAGGARGNGGSAVVRLPATCPQ